MLTDARRLRLIKRVSCAGRPSRLDTHMSKLIQEQRAKEAAHHLAIEEDIQRGYKNDTWPMVGEVYWTITPPHRPDKPAGLPRIVTRLDKNKGAVYVRAPRPGGLEWPVYKFWVYYTAVNPKGR